MHVIYLTGLGARARARLAGVAANQDGAHLLLRYAFAGQAGLTNHRAQPCVVIEAAGFRTLWPAASAAFSAATSASTASAASGRATIAGAPGRVQTGQ